MGWQPDGVFSKFNESESLCKTYRLASGETLGRCFWGRKALRSRVHLRRRMRQLAEDILFSQMRSTQTVAFYARISLIDAGGKLLEKVMQ
jgi:hypothetical protein